MKVVLFSVTLRCGFFLCCWGSSFFGLFSWHFCWHCYFLFLYLWLYYYSIHIFLDYD